MIRKYILVLPCILPVLFSHGQEKNTGYQLIYNYKLRLPNLVVDGQKTIVIGNNKQSLSWTDINSATQGGEAKGNRIFADDKSQKILPVYKDFENGSLVFEVAFGHMPKNRRIFSDSLHHMDWQVTGEEKIIDSISCVAATCSFRGRDYSAWFAPSIPIAQGPWKLGGLPGLIILVTDSESVNEWKLLAFTPANPEIPAAPAPQDNFQAYQRIYTETVRKTIEAAEARRGIESGSASNSKSSLKIETIERF